MNSLYYYLLYDARCFPILRRLKAILKCPNSSTSSSLSSFTSTSSFSTSFFVEYTSPAVCSTVLSDSLPSSFSHFKFAFPHRVLSYIQWTRSYAAKNNLCDSAVIIPHLEIKQRSEMPLNTFQLLGTCLLGCNG